MMKHHLRNNKKEKERAGWFFWAVNAGYIGKTSAVVMWGDAYGGTSHRANAGSVCIVGVTGKEPGAQRASPLS